MRCQHCAGEVPPAARFCPICGRALAGASVQPGASDRGRSRSGAVAPGTPGATRGPPVESMSLFELPVSRGARRARIAAVLALDLVLAGAGVAMMWSYFDDRAAAAASATEPAVVPPPRVEALEPAAVEPEDVARAPDRPARPRARTRSGARRRATRAGAGATGRADAAPGLAGDRPPAPGRAPDAALPLAQPGRPRPSPEPEPEPEPSPEPAGERPPPAAPDAGPGTPSPPDGAGASPAEVDQIARAVRREVDRHTIQLQKCYQRAAKQETSRSDKLEGRIDIQFVITPAGTATHVRPVANTTGSTQLARCVASLIESWQFPSPGTDEVAFVWPFVFKAP
ncbi:MAG: hypothetical protein D6689_01135 [Deltaproteobacteria bacterium]|nr:MAG: hypothetical protein D6689_01135 [Deltaproteobacteria bacterium]